MTAPVTLALDASARAGSAAVVLGGRVLAERTVAVRDQHAELLMPALVGALADAGLSVADVARVACGAGPGSFTGLRIAASLAKGIAAARSLPLYARSSLALMVAAAEPVLPAGRYLATLGALRGETFVEAVTVAESGAVIEQEAFALMTEEQLWSRAQRERAAVVGPGRDIDLLPHARGFARDERTWFGSAAPVDLALWEPLYGRVAEAQARWEAAHGRPLPAP